LLRYKQKSLLIAYPVPIAIVIIPEKKNGVPCQSLLLAAQEVNVLTSVTRYQYIIPYQSNGCHPEDKDV